MLRAWRTQAGHFAPGVGGASVLKRLTWAGLGLVTGLGASTWLEYQARKRLRRYLRSHPGPRYAVAAGEAALGKLEGMRLALADATEEGRRAMQERERELRARLTGREP